MPAQYEVMHYLGSAIKIKRFAPTLSKRVGFTSWVRAFEKFAWFLGLHPFPGRECGRNKNFLHGVACLYISFSVSQQKFCDVVNFCL